MTLLLLLLRIWMREMVVKRLLLVVLLLLGLERGQCRITLLLDVMDGVRRNGAIRWRDITRRRRDHIQAHRTTIRIRSVILELLLLVLLLLLYSLCLCGQLLGRLCDRILGMFDKLLVRRRCR